MADAAKAAKAFEKLGVDTEKIDPRLPNQIPPRLMLGVRRGGVRRRNESR